MTSGPRHIVIEREFEFTKDDFDYLRQMVITRTGIVVPDEKMDMFYSRLARRVRKLELLSFKQYCDLIRNEKDGAEAAQLINAITTNLTSFFRESYHFDFLAESLIPDLIEREPKRRRLSIWSAGCSTGEEPYSIAITLSQLGLVDRGWDIKILATDIDSNVLEHGVKGVYGLEQINVVPDRYVKAGFLRGKKGKSGKVSIKPNVRRMVEFMQLNLNSQWSLPEQMDMVFCRNVIIYFDKESKRALVNRIADNLKEGGYLFIGHSESLFRVSERFELVGKTIYRKKV